jgi:intracellular multiplication protein IcmQ
MTFNLASSARFDLKNEELKRHLVECVNEKKRNFVQLAEKFYHLNRRADTDYRQLCQSIIATIDQVLTTDDWETSLFLRNTLKPLRKLRDQAQELLIVMGDDVKTSYVAAPLAPNATKLYISLYQANGHDLKQWAAQLASLSSYMIGRPIYANEADVIQIIRTKLSQLSEAYVVVAVDRDKIITDSQSRARKDRLGHVLISLLPDAIASDKIVEFVHQGKHYAYRDQQLTPIINEDVR